MRVAGVGRGWLIEVPVLAVSWVNRQCVDTVQRVVREPDVAMLGQSVTASRTWTGCCIAERRSQNRCWQLGRVESGELATKTEPCLSTTDQ